LVASAVLEDFFRGASFNPPPFRFSWNAICSALLCYREIKSCLIRTPASFRRFQPDLPCFVGVMPFPFSTAEIVVPVRSCVPNLSFDEIADARLRILTLKSLLLCFSPSLEIGDISLPRRSVPDMSLTFQELCATSLSTFSRPCPLSPGFSPPPTGGAHIFCLRRGTTPFLDSQLLLLNPAFPWFWWSGFARRYSFSPFLIYSSFLLFCPVGLGSRLGGGVGLVFFVFFLFSLGWVGGIAVLPTESATLFGAFSLPSIMENGCLLMWGRFGLRFTDRAHVVLFSTSPLTFLPWLLKAFLRPERCTMILYACGI